jgi:glycerol-3-phosphate acyltransferase PlsX
MPHRLPGGPAARIAVDAFGSDGAPAVEVEGALLAVGEGRNVILVGDRPRLEDEVARLRRGQPWPEGLTLHHASQVVSSDESPAQAVRRKPDSSMRVACELVHQGQADAVLSAGHSGAMMASALLALRRLPAVDRPAIATVFPTLAGASVLLDVGANVDCKPQQLVEFALMGASFARLVHGKAVPRVGVLSNGTEAGKGTAATREALAQLRALASGPGAAALLSGPGASPSGLPRLELLGYVEGRDIFTGQADVVVCDGFVGNLVLKSCEGLAESVFKFLRAEVERRWVYQLGAWLMRGAFRTLKRRMDHAETGGALLLGVAGVALVCHGASSALAIRNAIGVADGYVRARAVAGLQAELEQWAAVQAGPPSPPGAPGGPPVL